MRTINKQNRSPQLAELKISYRRRRPPVAKTSVPTTPFTSAKEVEAYLRAVWNQDTLDLVEDFVVVCLNTALEPLGWVRVSSGGMEATLVDPRIIFAVALKAAATGIVVAHNHPSGNTSPSDHDTEVTKRLADGAKLLGMRFVDHIILTRKSAYSFAGHNHI